MSTEHCWHPKESDLAHKPPRKDFLCCHCGEVFELEKAVVNGSRPDLPEQGCEPRREA